MTESLPGVSTHHAATNAVMAEPRGDVGVLLVHGIGDHKEGETLTSFGEPLLDWIREWLRRGTKDAGDNPVVLRGARLRAARNEADSPAYAEGIIRHGLEREEQWLLCEAWWGDSVHPPAALQLLLWLWSRGPLLIFWHFYVQDEPGAPRTHDEKERIGMRTFAAVALAAGCQLIVTIALLLWLIPIGKWRGVVASTVRALTLTLGDSYVLLEHDIQRAALVERVRRSLEWLASRCTTVAVVAHSQGGAIAYEALARADRAKVAAFVSVGSGLEKLLFLRMVRRDGTGVIAAPLVAPFTVCAVSFFGYSLRPAGESWQLIPAVLSGMVAIGLMAKLALAFGAYRRRLATDAAALALDRTPDTLVSWTDVAASRDLVPQVNGSLITGQPFVSGYVTDNERSYFYDHIGYFQSRTGAMPRIWQALSKVSSLPLFTDDDVARLERFNRLHRWQTIVLVFARWMTYVALFVGLFAFRNTMAVFGQRIIDGVASSPFEDLLKPVRAIAGGVAWLLQETGIRTSATDLSPALVGSLVLVLGLTLWSLAFRAYWRAGSIGRWRLACEGGSVLDTAGDVWRARLRCVALGGVSTLPLLYAMTMIAAPALLQPSRFGVAVAMVLATGCFLAAVLLALATPWYWPLNWPVTQRTRTEDLQITAPAETLAYPLSAVVVTAVLSACGAFVWSQVSDRSSAPAIVAIALLHALSWQVYGLRRPGSDVGVAARLSMVGLPLLALALAWRWTSAADWSVIALAYAGVGIVTAIAAVLSRRGDYMRAALPVAMRELWRAFLIYR